MGVYYKPPASPLHLLDKLKESLARIPPTVPTILCGDFNAASIDWEMCTPLSGGPVQSRLCDIVQDNSLHQLVQHGTMGNNILDLVLTTDLTLIDNTSVVDSLDGFDHNAVQFGVKLCVPRTNQPKIYVYNFKKAEFNSFKEHLVSISLECIQMDGDIEENWQKWKDIFNAAVE